MEILFLRFAANTEHRVIDEDTPVHWVLSSDDTDANNCGKVKLSHAAELIQDRKVVILLPIEQLFVSTVAVQTKNRKQLEKAIPYALEDDLTEDIENVHFASGKRTDDGEIPVIVIAKANLDHLISILSSVNILPDIITSDIYGLEWKENQWTLCIDEQHLLARTSAWDGFGCETSDFVDFIQFAMSGQETKPERFEVYSHPDENLEYISKLENVAFDDFWSPASFVRGFNEEECINLLQGSYAKADKTHKTVRPWKIAAALAAIWFVISVAHVGLEYSRLNKLDGQLTAEIEQVFSRTFPDARNIVNPRVQMQQRLKKLTSNESATSDADFLKYLHQSGYELYKNQNISITDIQYKNNELSLDIKTKDIQVLEAVKSKLQSKQINAELQAAKSVDDFVLAKMLVKEAQ